MQDPALVRGADGIGQGNRDPEQLIERPFTNTSLSAEFVGFLSQTHQVSLLAVNRPVSWSILQSSAPAACIDA